MTYLSTNDLAAALPRWKCHKVVQAARIIDVLSRPLRLRLDVEFGEGKFTQDSWFQPKPDIASRHTPVPGDYLVRYDDGYLSLSPAKAFEEGYSAYPPTVESLQAILDADPDNPPESEAGAAAGASDGPAAAAAPSEYLSLRCGHAEPPPAEGEMPSRRCRLDGGHDGHHQFFPHVVGEAR